MGIKKVFETICMASLGLSIAIGLMVLVGNSLVWNDCYESHFQECEYAHSINQTYSYCSGFIGEPNQDDFEIFCSFHPQEGCNDIPHGCALQENEYLRGFRIPYTKLEWTPFAW